MSKAFHSIYLGIFGLIIVFVFITLAYNGASYYRVSQEERFYHPDHARLKSSGYIGHSLGIAGSLCIITGVGTYMARKRFRFLSRFGLVKYWLEFHIFICILGTLLILFHTAFKFGGLAAVSFWSMTIVFLSGIAGRVIYLQIPRTMEGRELDLREVREMRDEMTARLMEYPNLDEEILRLVTVPGNDRLESLTGNRLIPPFKKYLDDKASIRKIGRVLKTYNLGRTERLHIVALVREDIRLERKIERLELMKEFFRYWHVFHLPFALMMLFFMIVHVTVTVALGYRWIF